MWDSTPGGRGRVVETVETYEPRVGQTAKVEDPKLTGTQIGRPSPPWRATGFG